MWQYTGRERPPFAVEPGPEQESVWDYPRPPAVLADEREVIVVAGGERIARSRRALRVLETASPPTFYLPSEDVTPGALVPCRGASRCEWKGAARYFALAADPGTPVAWDYPEPNDAYAALAGHLAFYPARVACFVDGVAVQPQAGGFYGGWVTPELAGPWKGEPGTGHW